MFKYSLSCEEVFFPDAPPAYLIYLDEIGCLPEYRIPLNYPIYACKVKKNAIQMLEKLSNHPSYFLWYLKKINFEPCLNLEDEKKPAISLKEAYRLLRAHYEVEGHLECKS